MLDYPSRSLRAARLLSPERGRLATRGSALLITLAFVLLLSVVILAFLSHSLLEQQISTSNANQTKADIFAQGTAATIIGDLQGEIQSAANSTKVPLAVGNLYLPKIPANNVPIYDLNGGAGGAALTANLLKVSNKAAVGTMPVASGIATTVASLNNRAVSVNQWYGAAGPQLVDPTAAPATPQWVLVGRDGTNPPFAAAGAAKSTAYSPITPQSNTTVTGRYAYAIYDEGGLIDVNAAGKPSNLATNYGSYPIGEGDADLAQLNSATLAALTPQQIDQIIAYRNYASVQNTPYPGAANGAGGFTAGTVKYPKALPAINALSYFFYVLGNPLGFLNTSNAALAGTASDQRFTNRQQLIQFFTSLTAGTGNTGLLQYLTHFSRDLDQPSYAPAAGAPKVTAYPASNSNSFIPADVYTPNGGNSASGNDVAINPSFLQIRVKAAFTRNDGSAAKVGDPLVKTRFNLNRLAWITYKGPLSDGHLGAAIAKNAEDINSTDADLTIMAGYLHDNYGLSWAFLQQGTAANIYNYFGLSWVKDIRVVGAVAALGNYANGDNQLKWVYNHNNAVVFNVMPVGAGTILHLTDINGLGATTREPDFFELLKAAIACGSKAKPATLPTDYPQAVLNAFVAASNFTAYGSIYSTVADSYQYYHDSSLDNAIVQIGVNIIDEAKLDGFASRILFSDGSTPKNPPIVFTLKEFHGNENLPYFYNLRYDEVVAIQPMLSAGPFFSSPYAGNPVAQPKNTTMPNVFGGTISTAPTVNKIGGTGAYVSMLFPEVWNPNDQNSPVCAVDLAGNALTDSAGKPLMPNSLRIVAESIDPDHIYAAPALKQNADFVGFGYFKLFGNSNYEGFSSGTAGLSAGQASPGNAQDPGGTLFFNPDQPPGTGLFTLLSHINPNLNNPNDAFVMTAESTAMTFTAGAGAFTNSFHDPTLLAQVGIPNNSNLAVAGAENVLNMKVVVNGNTIPNVLPDPHVLVSGGGVPSALAGGAPFIGFYANVFAPVFYQYAGNNTTHVRDLAPNDFAIESCSNFQPNGSLVTARMQYEFPTGSGVWHTYDEKFCTLDSATASLNTSYFRRKIYQGNPPSLTFTTQPGDVYLPTCLSQSYDPRSSRFGMVSYSNQSLPVNFYAPLPAGPTPSTMSSMWTDAVAADNLQNPATVTLMFHFPATTGFFSPGPPPNPNPNPITSVLPNSNALVSLGSYTQNLKTGTSYYADPDGVVRRASGAAAAGTVGLPMAALSNAPMTQGQSRNIFLHRPFRNVAELGYVFSGTPWKNLDFENSESGDSSLLDVFTVGDPPGPTPLVAGKVNLNTQQIPVLQAILAGNYRDEETNAPVAVAKSLPNLTAAEAQNIAAALTARTLQTNAIAGQGPLGNVSELVGHYIGVNAATNQGTQQGFAGFSDDIPGKFAAANLPASASVQRFKESAIRGLAAAGQTRVWNLLIDVVAQTGRYPTSAITADQFNVEGQQRYWIHLAIDRLTGQIIDKQVELVKE